MYRIVQRAAALLLAAGAFGLVRPVVAQSPAPFPASLATAPTTDAPGDVLALPRVVPPTPRSGPPVKPNLDLLTPPALPTAWSKAPSLPTITLAPPPAKPTPATAAAPAPTTSRPGVDAYPASMTPPPMAKDPKSMSPWWTPPTAMAPHALSPITPAKAPSAATDHSLTAARPPASAPTIPDHAPSAAHPLSPSAPVVASIRPSVQPAPAPHVWPAAYLTRDESRPYEATALVYFETPIEPMKPAAAVKPSVAARRPEPSKPGAAAPTSTAVPVVPSDLRQRLLKACGRDATDVTVVNQPDKTVLVTVRVRDAAAETKVTEKILQLPEMALSTVHLALKVWP